MKTFRVFCSEANDMESLKRKPPGSRTSAEKQRLIDAGLDDFVRGGKTQSPVSDVAGIAATGLAVKSGLGGGLARGLSALSKLDMAKKVFKRFRKQTGSKTKYSTVDGDAPSN